MEAVFRVPAGNTALTGQDAPPKAVYPAHQRIGIGNAMTRSWLKNCAREQDKLPGVLDHPKYYSKFGFVPSTPHGILWEQKMPDDVFMVLELREEALEQINGTVRFHELFNEV